VCGWLFGWVHQLWARSEWHTVHAVRSSKYKRCKICRLALWGISQNHWGSVLCSALEQRRAKHPYCGALECGKIEHFHVPAPAGHVLGWQHSHIIWHAHIHFDTFDTGGYQRDAEAVGQGRYRFASVLGRRRVPIYWCVHAHLKQGYWLPSECVGSTMGETILSSFLALLLALLLPVIEQSWKPLFMNTTWSSEKSCLLAICCAGQECLAGF